MCSMKKNFIFIFPALMLWAVACQKDEAQNIIDPAQIQHLTIKNDPVQLNERLSIKDELVKMNPRYQSELKSTTNPEKDYSANFTFKLRADVDAPTDHGRTLMATHVALKDKYAFVSYNYRGEEFGGAVEVFDVEIPKQPKIISNATFTDADINAVDFKEGKIFIVGATADYVEMEFSSPAFFQVLSLNSQMQIISVDTLIDIPSFSANGIKVTDQYIYITSGDSGGLTIFDRQYNLIKQESIVDARSVDTNSENVYILSGQPGKINVFSRADNELTTGYEIYGANTPWSKSEISVTDQYIFAALNEEGVKMINTDGTLKQHIPKPETPAGDLDENHVSNSVSVNNTLVFMANGQSGITVGEIVSRLDDEVVILGEMVFNDMQSANFVKSNDSIVFVASGLGGLKILSVSIDEGVPDDIIPTEPCPALMNAINLYLPERENAQNHSPQLFVAENALNVVTAEETPVYVVFVNEGAGWKNSFGYYAYPADNPPASVEELQNLVVFPNVSSVNDGGGLEPGDMVQLGSEPFPANTVVGFFLVAQGWKNGQMVNGVYTHYTNREFNPSSKQQHLLFIENGCQDMVLAFEDIRIPGGDKDYNDIILVIKDNDKELPNTKFNIDGIVNINVVNDEDVK